METPLATKEWTETQPRGMPFLRSSYFRSLPFLLETSVELTITTALLTLLRAFTRPRGSELMREVDVLAEAQKLRWTALERATVDLLARSAGKQNQRGEGWQGSQKDGIRRRSTGALKENMGLGFGPPK